MTYIIEAEYIYFLLDEYFNDKTPNKIPSELMEIKEDLILKPKLAKDAIKTELMKTIRYNKPDNMQEYLDMAEKLFVKEKIDIKEFLIKHIPEQAKKIHSLKTKPVGFSYETKLGKKDDPQCSICLNNLKGKLLRHRKCKRLFHKECLEEWFAISRTCPLCRGLFGTRKSKRKH